jgi:hypothetical protein
LVLNPILEIFSLIFAPSRSDDDKLPSKMTSSDLSLPIPELQQIAAAFAVERQVLIPELAQLIEDKQKIAAGLLLWLSLAIGQTIADVKIERLERIYQPGRNQGLIDFKLVCLLPTQLQVHLGICILPFSDPEIVSEACTRLLVYKDFGLDRLCLIRQSDLMTNVRQLPACLPKLLSTDIGGHFIPLKSQDILSVLTTLSVFQHKQQHGVTNELMFAYLMRAELLTKNELIKNIMIAAQF